MRDPINGRFSNKHGMSRTSEYNIWGNIIYRCTNKKCSLYPSYGGRGIRVCDQWMSFECFIRDMGQRPSKDHSIDRIDVDGDYCKDNCRWATAKQQARNRSNSRFLMVNGEKMQVDDYCEKYGLNKMAIKSRIKRGWSDERITSTPIKRTSKC